MPRLLILATVLYTFAPEIARADESAWMFRPSHFTHSPASGERVAQYEPERPAYVRYDPTYQESGYVHSETTLRAGESAEHVHIVQTWGQGTAIRPYGEWERPFRAGATPYGPWGNPGGPWALPFDSWQNPYGLGRSNFGYGGFGIGGLGNGGLGFGGGFAPAVPPGPQNTFRPGPAAAVPPPPAPRNPGMAL